MTTTPHTCDQLGVCKGLTPACEGCTGLHCQQARRPDLCDCGYIVPTREVTSDDPWTWVDDLKSSAVVAALAGGTAVLLGLLAGYLLSRL